jgi:hypothetical protein
MTEMHHEVTIARPPAEVLAFAADGRTWPRWHPTTVTTDVDGDRIAEVVRAGPLRGTIAWRVVERGPERVVLTGRVDFPFMRQTEVEISYRVSADGKSGTRFQRDLAYTSVGWVSRVADRLVFRRHNERQSRVALERLRAALEG